MTTKTINTKTINKFENHLLSLRAERQEMIHPSSHPTGIGIPNPGVHYFIIKCGI